MLNTSPSQFVGDIKELIECPSCSASLRRAKASLLFYSDAGHTIHLTCGKCSSNSIVRVSLDLNKPFVRILLTDISVDDINSCYTVDPIGPNDVLEVFHSSDGQSFDRLVGLSKD